MGGGEFSRKLKKNFKIFACLHLVSMHDLIFKHVNSNMIFLKTNEI